MRLVLGFEQGIIRLPVIRANHFLKKTAICSIHIFLMFLTAFPLFMLNSESFPFLFAQSLSSLSHSRRSLQKIDLERIAPVTLYRRVAVSDSLPLLMTKERWDRFANLSFAYKIERFA